MTGIKCSAAPCKSCPYRRDVPSGIWDASEYDKLPIYDGTIAEQAQSKGTAGLFYCHQDDGNLCAGWLGCHGAHSLLALRLASFYDDHRRLDDSVWTYKSPVKLFRSGREAAAHGKRAILRPGGRAQRAIVRLMRKRALELKEPE